MINIPVIVVFAANGLRTIERNENVRFSTSVKKFFNMTLKESLLKTNRSKYTNNHVTEELNQTFHAIRTTIHNDLSFPRRPKMIVIADFMRIVHLNWCGVYPFCKSLG